MPLENDNKDLKKDPESSTSCLFKQITTALRDKNDYFFLICITYMLGARGLHRNSHKTEGMLGDDIKIGLV